MKEERKEGKKTTPLISAIYLSSQNNKFECLFQIVYAR